MEFEELREFGLTANEIKIYIASLKLGSSPANKIAKTADILRPTTYEILTSLKNKGLVSSVIKSGVKYFSAINPKELIQMLEERKKKINKILPKLLSIKETVSEKPNIELYEGIGGLKSVMDDLVNTKKPILSFSSHHDLMGKLTYYFPNYVKRRVKEKIPIKVIVEESAQSNWPIAKDKKEFREMRFVPDKFDMPNAIYIYGDKISLLDLNKTPETGIIIQNPELNKTFQAIFNQVWATAKPNK